MVLRLFSVSIGAKLLPSTQSSPQGQPSGKSGVTGSRTWPVILSSDLKQKEYIDKKHLFGAVFMLISAVIILSPNVTYLRPGDFFVLAAVMVAPFGNLLQKQLRTKVNSEQILFFRTLIATPVLFVVAYFLGETISLPAKSNWLVIILNGVVLFGFTKILWIESIHRLGVTKSISLSSLSPVFTLFFAFLILKDMPTVVQITAIPPAILGVYLLTRPVRKNYEALTV